MQLRTTRLCALVALVIVILMLARSLSAASLKVSKTNTTASGHKRFRCQRPFSAMTSFKQLDSSFGQKNCDFYYFHIRTASAKATCEVTESAQPLKGGEERTLTCTVELEVEAKLASEALTRVAWNTGSTGQGPNDAHSSGAAPPIALLDSDDVWRYTLQLRSTAERNTAVHYKGYDSHGYSLCCHAILEAECKWVYSEKDHSSAMNERLKGESLEGKPFAHHVLSSCPLPLLLPARANASGPGVIFSPPQSGVFHISVRRPVPRFVPGLWEARLELWRERVTPCVGQKQTSDRAEERAVAAAISLASDPEMLGRVIIPFELFKSELRQARNGTTQATLPVVALQASYDEQVVNRPDL